MCQFIPSFWPLATFEANSVNYFGHFSFSTVIFAEFRFRDCLGSVCSTKADSSLLDLNFCREWTLLSCLRSKRLFQLSILQAFSRFFHYSWSNGKIQLPECCNSSLQNFNISRSLSILSSPRRPRCQKCDPGWSEQLWPARAWVPDLFSFCWLSNCSSWCLVRYTSWNRYYYRVSHSQSYNW